MTVQAVCRWWTTHGRSSSHRRVDKWMDFHRHKQHLWNTQHEPPTTCTRQAMSGIRSSSLCPATISWWVGMAAKLGAGKSNGQPLQTQCRAFPCMPPVAEKWMQEGLLGAVQVYEGCPVTLLCVYVLNPVTIFEMWISKLDDKQAVYCFKSANLLLIIYLNAITWFLVYVHDWC